MMNDKCELLKRIDCVSFAALELRLYLDTHPCCSEGLSLYNTYVEERRRLIDKYEAQFGPLIADNSQNIGEKWQWVCGPWPWEYQGGKR